MTREHGLEGMLQPFANKVMLPLQGRAVVWHAPAIVAVFPFNLARLTINKRDRIEAAKADQDVAVGHWRDRVGMGELVTMLARADRVSLDVHVTARVPFPDNLLIGRDLVNAVAVHAAISMVRIGKAAGHTLRDFGRHNLPREKNCIAVGQTAEVVMLADMPVFPHHVAIPIVFAQQPAATPHLLRPFGKPARPKQIAILQKVAIGAGG